MESLDRNSSIEAVPPVSEPEGYSGAETVCLLRSPENVIAAKRFKKVENVQGGDLH